MLSSYAVDNMEMVTRFRIVVMKYFSVDVHVTFSLMVLESSTLGPPVLLCFYIIKAIMLVSSVLMVFNLIAMGQ